MHIYMKILIKNLLIIKTFINFACGKLMVSNYRFVLLIIRTV